ncbi:MAG: glycosyltransferase [Rhizobacter sp.]|nr:glycosyltransferase [Chlorobiales bacterium]
MTSPKKLFLVVRFFFALLTQQVDLVWVYIAVPQYTVLIVLIGKLFGKKVFTITGGYEITYIPGINWGEMNSWIKRTSQRIAFSQIDLVLAYSEASRADILKFTLAAPEKVKVLHFGVDTNYFKPWSSLQKRKLIITVCANLAAYSIEPKGVVTLVEAARTLTDVDFVVVGAVHDDAKAFTQSAPPNVKFVGRVSDQDLLRLYQEAKVYAQLSAHEGFGIANIEAMSCECASVVTPTAALPEVVGEAGLYVPFGDVSETVSVLKEALQRDDLRIKARERIISRFRDETRRAQLLAEIQTM